MNPLKVQPFFGEICYFLLFQHLSVDIQHLSVDIQHLSVDYFHKMLFCLQTSVKEYFGATNRQLFMVFFAGMAISSAFWYWKK